MEEQYFYSPSLNGFFYLSMKPDYEKSETGWPDDALPISARWYQYLIDNNTEKVIVPNQYGQPVLSEPLPLTTGERIARAESHKMALMAEAEEIIAPLSRAVKLGIATPEEVQRLEQWETYTVILSRVSTADPSSVEWPPVPE
ncbi:tail fiber assembly protein [Enterobacter sp. MW07]|nr:tail fiber assembly protein [Enterobacter sp. MW07]